MQRMIMLICVVGLLPLASTGCGPDCEAICKDRQRCSIAEEVDCELACDDAEDFADMSGCTGAYERYLECFEDTADSCTMSCSTQGSNYLECTVEWTRNQSPAAQLLGAFGR